MELLTLSQAIVGLLGLLLLCNLCYNRSFNRRRSIFAPEASRAWPIIGHLHQLGGKVPICRTLGAMADKYGPVFLFRLGMRRVLVVNTWEGVKECFTTNDRAFASRPLTSAGKYLGYNYAAFAFSAYGPYWRDVRKLVTVELLSTRRLETLKHLLVSEVDTFVTDLHAMCDGQNDAATKVDMGEMLHHLTINVISKLVARKRYFGNIEDGNDEEAQKIRRVIKEFNHVAWSNVLSDLFPFSFLEWLDPQGLIKLMKRIAKDIDSIIQGWIDEHRQKKRLVNEMETEQDFIDLMQSVLEKGAITSEYTNETIIKSTIEILILAGTDTMAIAMTWLLSLLLNDGHALMCVQEELDQKVGRERWVEESDIQSLIYLQAVIKETLRLYPPGPFGAQHESIEDCKVLGYHIPKGTAVMVNIWKLHRDPRVWTSPDKFIPERFLTSQATFDLSGRHFELIPFGSGRRSCPGITLAQQVLHLTMARLLQGFNLSKPTETPIDMAEAQGVNLFKVIPLEVVLTPRLNPKLYQELRGTR
ncbi:hypothetical protein Ancab_039709 [Ancistrocladus abbreviatus]